MKAQQQSLFSFTPTAPPPPPRRNLVIEAGAGTGKTTAIVARVLELLLSDETLAPERIVLVTFTEKAAAEISERIREGLRELGEAFESGTDDVAWPAGSSSPLMRVEAADRARAKRACAHHLSRIDALRSQTIHAFCQSLLRTFPIEANLDPQFRIIQGFDRSLLYGELYDAWVEHETRTAPVAENLRDWQVAFGHYLYLFFVRAAVFELLDRRDLLDESGYDCGAVTEFEDVVIPELDVIRSTTAVPSDDDAARFCEHVRRVANPARGASTDEWLAWFEPVKAALGAANLPAIPKGPLKEAFKTLRGEKKGKTVADRLQSHRVAMSLLALTRRFIAWLDTEKKKRGVVDFDDLLLRTLALLGDDTVLERARQQFDFIFVDEFQDTDRTQARILEKLAQDRSGEWVPGKLVVVGDPKQSIYGFRRADPQTYHQLTTRLREGGAKLDELKDQYRSDPPLLDAINAIFTVLFPRLGDDPNVFRPAYSPLRAGRARSARELDARITFLQTSSEEKAERRLDEAATIAAWIAKHRRGDEEDLKRFAILFRRLTILDDYLEALEQQGVDYVLPPTRLFLDRPVAVDLLAVLRAIAYRFDQGAQISAARTPYFSLTDEEIAAGVLSADPQNGIDPDRAAPWNDFLQAIGAFAASASHLTVSRLIEHVIDTTGIETLYRATLDSQRSLRYLEHLRAIAFAFDQQMGGSVQQFVDEIARRREEPDEMEPSLVDESRNAVRILTVHAAKGLEFETVIVPDLEFSSGSDSTQLFTTESPRSLIMTGRAETISGNFRSLPGGERLKSVASQRSEAEMQRLFYVAVTRARSEVVFLLNAGAKVKKSGFRKCIDAAFGLDAAALQGLWPAGEQRDVHPISVGGVVVPCAFERVAARSSDPRDRKVLENETLEQLLRTSEPVPPFVPQPMHAATTLERAEINRRRVRSRQRTAGVLLHRFLELWSGEPAEPLLRRLALEAAADDQTIARVRRRIDAVMRSPVLERIRAAETIGREFPIRFTDANGIVVERRIDRLIRENGVELVVDYKSGRPDEARLEADRDQVRRYGEAISAMTGRPCGGLLWYIDLDNDTLVEG